MNGNVQVEGERRLVLKLWEVGRVAPKSRYEWPEPGEWVETGPIVPCQIGIHAPVLATVAAWQGYWERASEVWLLEVGGETRRYGDANARKSISRRGRLVRSLGAWSAIRLAHEATDLTAWEAYEATRRTAWEAYEATRRPAWEAYEATVIDGLLAALPLTDEERACLRATDAWVASLVTEE